MREIKFRAFDAVLGIRPVLSIDFEGGVVWVAGKELATDYGHTWDGPSAYSLSIENANLMQYIGMKDKGGREIYEGDIFIDPVEKTPAVVEWYRCMWVSKMSDGKLNGWPLFAFNNQIEIIGNIYENPELLSGHVNPNCHNPATCKPHGEVGPVEYEGPELPK